MGKKLFVLVVFVGFLNWYLGGAAVSSTLDEINNENPVMLYSTQWCGYCEKTRSFLKKNNIDYKEYDIEASEQGFRQYDALNGNGVPLMVVNKTIIRGYNPQAVMLAME